MIPDPGDNASGNGKARSERIESIVDAAAVRQALGQAALYRRLDGEHEIVFRGKRFTGATVDAAIQAAREGAVK